MYPRQDRLVVASFLEDNWGCGTSVGDLIQYVSALETLTNRTDELTHATKGKAVQLLTNIIGLFEARLDDLYLDDFRYLASDVASIISNLLEAALETMTEYTPDPDMSHAEIIWYEKEFGLRSANEGMLLKNLMDQLVAALNKFIRVINKRLLVGEPRFVVTRPSFELVIDRSFPDDVGSRVIEVGQGSVTLPGKDVMFSDGGAKEFVDAVVLVFYENPYSWNMTSRSLSTPVMEVFFIADEDEDLVMENLEDFFTLKLPNGDHNSTSPENIQTHRFSGPEEMLFYKVNRGSDDEALILLIQLTNASEGVDFEIFARKGQRPNETEYAYKAIERSRYGSVKFLIPPEALNGTGSYFIGVREAIHGQESTLNRKKRCGNSQGNGQPSCGIQSPEENSGSLEQSPEENSGSLEQSPEENSGSLEQSPEENSDSLEQNPVENSGSLEQSPEENSGSLEQSPEENSGSLEQSPVENSGSSEQNSQEKPDTTTTTTTTTTQGQPGTMRPATEQAGSSEEITQGQPDVVTVTDFTEESTHGQLNITTTTTTTTEASTFQALTEEPESSSVAGSTTTKPINASTHQVLTTEHFRTSLVPVASVNGSTTVAPKNTHPSTAVTTGNFQTHTVSGKNATLSEIRVEFFSAACLFWDESAQIWSSQGCHVGANTDAEDVECLCNHLTAFGGNFNVAPNSINFATVFAKFGQLDENPVVFSFVISTLVAYFALLVWAKRKDKKDTKNWTVSPVGGNRPGDTCGYLVNITTGQRLGAGTRSNVGIIIYGTDGDTGARRLRDPDKKVFSRGHINSFLLTTPQPLGSLTHLHIWHDNSGKGSSAGWFLDNVVVKDLQGNKMFYFQCNQWLAVDQDDGRVSRVLPVDGWEQITDFKNLFSKSAVRQLFDGHLWFSVAWRPNRSNFSRVQRLSCCLTLLFCTMVTNAMFYRTDTSVKDPGRFTIGPLKLSMYELYVSVVSSVITLPVTLAVVELFRRSKPKPKVSRGTSDSVVKVIDWRVELAKKQLYKPPAPPPAKGLPYFYTYIAWCLVFLAVTASGFFTILYGLEWGREKSLDWLTSILLGIFESVLFVQPIKILVLAFVLSAIFKRPPNDNSVPDLSSVPSVDPTNEEGADGEEPHVVTPPGPPSEEELRRARLKRERDERMSKAQREILVYTFFLLALTVVSNDVTDTHAYNLVQSVNKAFVESSVFALEDVDTDEAFYTWANLTLVPNLYRNTWYNSDETLPWRERMFLLDLQNFRIGPARLRQTRKTKSGEVSIEDLAEKASGFLPDFNNIWAGVSEMFSGVSEINLDSSELWSDSDLALPVAKSYDPFSVILGANFESARRVVRALEENEWVKETTHVIVADFSVYNPGVNLFATTEISVEFLETGGLGVESKTRTFRLYNYEGTAVVFIIICQLVSVAFLVYFLVVEILELKRDKLLYFFEVWNYVELTIIALGIATIVLYFVRKVRADSILRQYQLAPRDYVDFEPVLQLDSMLVGVLSALVFVATLRMLRLVRHNKQVSLASRAIARASKGIMSFSLQLFITFCAFAVPSTLLFGLTSEWYRNILTASLRMLTLSFGFMDFSDMRFEGTRGILGRIFLALFLVTMFLVLINLFLAILADALTEVKQEVHDDDDDLLVYFWEKLKRILGLANQKGKDEPEKSGDKNTRRAGAEGGGDDKGNSGSGSGTKDEPQTTSLALKTHHKRDSVWQTRDVKVVRLAFKEYLTEAADRPLSESWDALNDRLDRMSMYIDDMVWTLWVFVTRAQEFLQDVREQNEVSPTPTVSTYVESIASPDEDPGESASAAHVDSRRRSSSSSSYASCLSAGSRRTSVVSSSKVAPELRRDSGFASLNVPLPGFSDDDDDDDDHVDVLKSKRGSGYDLGDDWT
ncbi:polycystic kidney disease protein 1-like 2 [Branchiostoma floridae]|uniref:Polycystic kidney disease protein 1-like 2 n=2 Tax=Branchiostoma floridae TaxID=7739 RepID=A0A9J7KY84_BRAFL|nr:polycystic kidney disease protein 1-like 2 [Branchiostoma floridae]